MDFVDKEHIVFLQTGEQTGQVARFVEHRARREFESHAELVGYDIGKRRLAQSRRTVQEGVVERFATVFCRFNEDMQVFHHLALTAEVTEAERTEGVLKFTLRRRRGLLLRADIKSIVIVHACKVTLFLNT